MSADRDRAAKMVGEARAILNPDVKGSDLSVLIDKIGAWVQTLDLGGMGREGLHILLHFATDELLPRLADMAPTYGKMILTLVVLPLLKKIDEGFHVPAPTT